MQTFEEIVDNGLTSREEVEMEHNAKEAAIRGILYVCEGELNTSLRYPQYWLNRTFQDGEL